MCPCKNGHLASFHLEHRNHSFVVCSQSLTWEFHQPASLQKMTNTPDPLQRAVRQVPISLSVIDRHYIACPQELSLLHIVYWYSIDTYAHTHTLINVLNSSMNECTPADLCQSVLQHQVFLVGDWPARRPFQVLWMGSQGCCGRLRAQESTKIQCFLVKMH